MHKEAEYFAARLKKYEGGRYAYLITVPITLGNGGHWMPVAIHRTLVARLTTKQLSKLIYQRALAYRGRVAWP